MPSPKSPAAANRKKFVRTKIPLVEQIASALILLLLVGIGVTIGIKGHHFNPDLYSVRTDSLNSTSTAVEGKSQTVQAEPGQSAPARASSPSTDSVNSPPAAASDKPMAAPEASPEGGGEGSAAAAKPAAPGKPLEIALDGIKPMSDTEFYDADNLFQKIDGRSPAYQGFNVQGLRCRTFSVLAASGSFVDVYEYTFDSPLDAFGMYALERDPKGQPLDFASDGYSGEMGYFFRQGPVYVQIIASDVKPETMAVTKLIAQNRAKELPVDDSGLAGRRKLPSEGLIDGSVAFVLENAQGQSSLKNVFQAKYKADGVELPFFVMVGTPDETAKAWQSFQAFCARFGKTEALPDVNGAKIFRAQVFGKWKVIYVREGELGGAFDAGDADKSRAFVEKYLRGEIK